MKSLGRIADRQRIRPVIKHTSSYATTNFYTSRSNPSRTTYGVATALFGGLLLYYHATGSKLYADVIPARLQDLPKDVAKLDFSSQHDQVSTVDLFT